MQEAVQLTAHLVEDIGQKNEWLAEYGSALNNLGRCLAELGKTTEAVTQFSEAIRLDPAYLEARYNLGNVQLLLGHIDQAIHQFEEALRVNPSFTPAAKGLERAKAKKSGPPKTP